ncbi:MAG: PmoA family protein [Verrucomicrobiae bacterium]|nr:PmoA family protein [Verrucomicrobiae bacterium]MCP5539030.1 PmoA family protein [Akkermansiaceae bacterium]MCP5551184.1 PmoA family protein [Akkermansiaceae bacterium]
MKRPSLFSAGAFSLWLLLPLLAFTTPARGQVKIEGGARITAGATGGAGGWTITGTDPIEIRWGGEVVTAYQTGADNPKPFFYPLIGPTGENVTRHWPMKEGVAHEETDHVHHRSMWFGFGKVNGLDFWHEPGSKGKEGSRFGKTVHTGLKGMQISGANQSLTFHTTTDWVAVDGGQKICQDKRSFTLQHRDDGGFALDATFTIEATEGDVLFEDDKEGAFALRVMPTLRVKGEVAKGTMTNSAGQAGADVWGKRANWVDYSGPDSKGAVFGIAMFDHPTNFRNPSWWHARDYGLFAVNPFGQGKFEKGAAPDAGNYTIKNGESLTLRYRVLFHAGMGEAEKLNAEFKAFAGE